MCRKTSVTALPRRRQQGLLYLCYDSLESLRIVDSEVSEHLAVDLDAGLVERAHKLRVRKTLEACGSVDALNPESAERALLIAAVAESVGETLLPSVLGYGPHILARAEIAAGEFEDSLTFCS